MRQLRGEKLPGEMEGIVTDLALEVGRMKKIHDSVVKIQGKKIGMLFFCSKFASGKSSGGEFFDICKDRHHVLVLCLSAANYTLSSLALSALARIKGKSTIPHGAEIVEALCLEIERAKQDPRDLQVFLLKIDLATLEVTGFNFGRTQLLSTYPGRALPRDVPFGEKSLEKASFSTVLERGEKLVLFGPGVEKNEQSPTLTAVPEAWGNKSMEALGLEFLTFGGERCLREVFFRLRARRASEKFLAHDVSCLTLEVDHHGLIST